MDVIEGEHVYKWFRFEYRKGLTDGLGLYPCGSNNLRLEYSSEVFASTDECLTWALKKGVAPGQPFLLDIRPPSYDYETGDPTWDLEFSTRLVKKMPLSFDQAIRSWDRFFRRIAIQKAKQRRHLRHLVLNSSKYWNLSFSWIPKDNQTKAILTYEKKDVRKGGGCTFVWNKTLLSISVDGHACNDAFWKLFSVLENDYPGCNLKHLLTFAKGKDVSISRWHQIRFDLVQTSGDHS